jgi:voltage-gated potassium channel
VKASASASRRRSEESAARWQRRFEIPMLLIAALVIPSVLLDQPSVDDPWHTVGVALNWLIWTAFVVELVVMLAVAPSRWTYLRRNPLDLVIVVLTPPFLTSMLNGVRLLRLVRVSRLLRLKPLVRWMFARGGLKYASVFTGLVVLAAAEAFSVMQNTSYFNGLYWAVTTITTVGYGDELPTTPESKVLAMVVMVVGIGFFAALAGSLAERFIEGRAQQLVDDAGAQAVRPSSMSSGATEVDRRGREADGPAGDELLAKVDALAAQIEELRLALRARARLTIAGDAPGPHPSRNPNFWVVIPPWDSRTSGR